MDKTKISAKDVMKPHSEAKVLFYQKYLDIKLMIPLHARYTSTTSSVAVEYMPTARKGRP